MGLTRSLLAAFLVSSFTLVAAQGSANSTLCGTGFQFTCTTGTPIDTQNDAFNCGTPNFVCPADVANNAGASQCVAGQCTAPCASGYSFSPSTGGCIGTQFAADTTNCGGAATVCQVANGTPKCVSGSCTAFKCESGFTLVQNTCQSTSTSNDVLNCGGIGYACPVVNGASTQSCTQGVCTVSGCSTGYALNLNTCNSINLNSDPTNCGTVGTNCGSGGICNSGVCAKVSCSTGSVYNPALNACQSVSQDLNNCGAVGNVCPTSPSAVSQCVNSKCVTTNCPKPFTVVNNACALAASQAPHTKRGKLAKRITLCPGEEVACPIVGSAAYALAKRTGFSNFKRSDVSALSSAGGYECLDIKYSIESCGGCTSMGDGMDCLQIPHSSGVGCAAGVCNVFSCQAGYRPNLTATGCVRSATRQRRSNVKRSHIAHAMSH